MLTGVRLLTVQDDHRMVETFFQIVPNFGGKFAALARPTA